MPNPDGPFSDVIHQIGEAGDLTQARASKAARSFVAMLGENPGAEQAIMVSGFDDDPREPWDVLEVRAYVQCFVACALRYSGLPIPCWRLGESSMAFVAVCLGLARVVGRDPATGEWLIELERRNV